ncbi:MAG: septum formation initiator family protein [Deltaproteobacteria bacterium]|nr:septum formation initiator family protein [Deltaproteobacteria bacterium]
MRLRVLLAVSVVAALAVGTYTVLAPSGLARWFSLRDEERVLDGQLELALRENAALALEVQRLQSDPRVVEEAAREELGYVKKDELVLMVPEGGAR